MAEQESYLLAGSADPAPSPPDEHTWKPLRFLNHYRLFLGALFAILYQIDLLPQPLGSAEPTLFYAISLAYVAFAVLATFPIHRRIPDFITQVYFQIGVDIVAVTLLMHASGGMESGLGVLLVVSIASAGMLTEGRTAGLFAALATMALLVEQLHAHLGGLDRFVSYPRAGILGATFFATAILARVLARRIRDTEALAAQRGLDLANMARLTEYVIQQMDAGVLVVDHEHHIRLMNGAAWRLLGRPSALEQRTLESVSPELAERLRRWSGGSDDMSPVLLSADGDELRPRFIQIGEEQPAGFLIFLEDASAAAEQAQQLKLASLGRLTASIAHEVRNPLGAISHAGELLAESDHLDKADRRLTEIIGQQVQRVNAIIESVLQLGRREISQAVVLELGPWLERFVREFTQTTATAPGDVSWRVEPADLRVRIDPNHLHQILWNLCQNALHHARQVDGVKVELVAQMERGRAWLDVVDKGPGVPREVQPHLFEPFFTTERSGTGLGLYISRELAQYNRARLDYVPSADVPGRFRISFGLPEITAR